MTELFRPSGGVLYHLRAIRRGRLWKSFRAELAEWLATWPAPREELLLIGPSGGYSLPNSWLDSFKTIHCYDVDPLAPWLFRMRHRQANITFHKQDMFWQDGRLTLRALDRVLSRHPRAAVSFCNILGQLPLEGVIADGEWEAFLKQLRGCLETRSWLSYHDLYTIEPLPLAQHHAVAHAADPVGSLRGLGATSLEVTDHLLLGSWTRGLAKSRFAWSLTPTCLHVIEGVFGVGVDSEPR
jgi:hypothetical protein